MNDRPLLVIIDGLDGRNISAHQLAVGENLSKRVMAISPTRFNQQSVTIYRDCISPDKLVPLDYVPNITVQPEDFFLLRATPAQGAIMPVLTAAALAAAVYFTGGGIAAALLIGGVALSSGLLAGLIVSPQLPSGETNRDQASGLNTVGTPHNVARLRSRVPEIFGLMRIWPDLAIPPIEIWSGRSQKVTCLYCLGVGFYQISTYKLNETLISNLPGVAVTMYGPGETMPGLVVARESDTQQQIELDATGTTGGDFSAWITAVGDQLVELWLEIGFPSGLVVYKSSGGKRNETTAIDIEFQRTDVTGVVQTAHFSFTAATGNPLRYTVKITDLTPGVYRCRARRTDDGTHGDDDVHVSNVALIKVIGVEVLPSNSQQTYRNTFIKLVIDNNDQVAQLSALTFNLLVKRMLHLVQPGGVVDPHFTPTSFLRDAIYYALHDPALGNLFSSDIDLLGLYDLHATLKSVGSPSGGEDDDNTSNAEFNGVFDRWMSVDEMVQTMAQVGRAGAVYDGGRIIFMRDQDKPAPVSVFNRRVRPAEDESTRNLTILTPDQEDGISIDWKDADNGYADRTYIYPETAVNPKTIDQIGMTHWEQVWRRARYEWDRMTLRRRTAKITVTEEGLIVNPLDIVTVIDPWLDPVTDGDIIDYDATSRVVTIDQQVVPSAGSVMRIRNIEGDLTDDVEIIAGLAETDRIRLTRDPIFPIVPRDYKHQVGNLYVIGTTGFMEQHDWHVIDVQARDKKQVELNLIEYSPAVFLCDTLDVPDPPVLQ